MCNQSCGFHWDSFLLAGVIVLIVLLLQSWNRNDGGENCGEAVAAEPPFPFPCEPEPASRSCGCRR